MNALIACFRSRRWRSWGRALILSTGVATLPALAATPADPGAKPATSARTTPASPLPPTPVEDVVDVLHGTEVHDPYRWLESTREPRVLDWLRAQGRHASAELARLPGRDAMQARIAALMASPGDTVRDLVRLPGERLYYLKRTAGAPQFNLVMREGLRGRERVLVDAVALSRTRGEPHAINYFVPSWDGRRLAYGVSVGGSEDASLHVMDLPQGRALIAPVPRVPDGRLVAWAPDSDVLAYNQLKPPTPGEAPDEHYKDSVVWLMDVGSPSTPPRAVFSRALQPELRLDRLDVAGFSFVPGSRHVLVRTTDTTVPEGKLFVGPLDDVLAHRPVAWQAVSGFDDRITDAQLSADTLYLRTYAQAPRGRVLALPLDRPVLAQAREVVAEPATGVLESFALGRGAIYTEVREGFRTRLWRHALVDAQPGGTEPATPAALTPPARSGETARAALPGVEVAAGFEGSAYALPDPARAFDDLLFSTSAWTTPPRIMQSTRPGHWKDTGLRTARVPRGVPAIEVSEVIVPSHDGAPVPLAVMHKKGLALDGRRPTLLIGYGAYGFSMEARYDPSALAWLERGGVLALANVRGSGAYGDAWYRAGYKTTKANTWKDGIASARWLIDQRYASSSTLGIWGTSAGGIFVGRAVTTAPDLFAAAIFDVGVMDTVRFELTANGATNVSEFGTVNDPTDFRGLLDMSTYHHVRDGVAYPGVLLVHGLNDPRVDVWQSAKTAARLQAASSSGRPVLLRIDEQAGHGVGSTAGQRAAQLADIYSFLLHAFERDALAR